MKIYISYVIVARTLSDLLHLSTLHNFGLLQCWAIETLKHLLIIAPILHIFIPKSDLEVHSNGGKYGFGTVLLQKCSDGKFYPIQCMSKKTSPQKEKLCGYKLEVLAAITALKKFKVYLHGTKFKLTIILSRKLLIRKTLFWKWCDGRCSYKILILILFTSLHLTCNM